MTRATSWLESGFGFGYGFGFGIASLAPAHVLLPCGGERKSPAHMRAARLGGRSGRARLRLGRPTAKPVNQQALPCLSTSSILLRAKGTYRAEATRRAWTNVVGPIRCEPRSRWPSFVRRAPRAACPG